MKITSTFYQEFGTFNMSLYGSIQGAQCLTILYTISTLQPSHSNKQGSWTLLELFVIIFSSCEFHANSNHQKQSWGQTIIDCFYINLWNPLGIYSWRHMSENIVRWNHFKHVRSP
jgi:hypothetical protein